MFDIGGWRVPTTNKIKGSPVNSLAPAAEADLKGAARHALEEE
jgi:hypothetical protein